MSYVLDLRELVHKLPFHHFSAYELKSSCVVIAMTYATPPVVAAGVCLFYYRTYTLQNRMIFENTNIREAKTRGIITVCVLAAFGPAAMIGMVEGFKGGLATLKTIEAWADRGQRGMEKIALPIMQMDDALTALLGEADDANDVAAKATITSALSTVTTMLMHHGNGPEFIEDLNALKWVNVFTWMTAGSIAMLCILIVGLIFTVCLPIVAHHGRTPVAKWWKKVPGRMTPEFFVRAVPVWMLVFSWLVIAMYWPVSVMGAEICFAYEGMVEFQVPENIQLYFVCPRFGYELGPYIEELHADRTAVTTAIENVDSLGGSYASSASMASLTSAVESYKGYLDNIDEGLGSCQPMSDTIELAVVQVCDEVILALQMFTALAFGLTCLLMYGTLHKWFGSDVAKELANDEEQSLFSKLTSESMLEARSKFGAVEKKKTEAEKKKEKEEKKLKKKKKAVRGSASASADVSGDEAGKKPTGSRSSLAERAEEEEEGGAEAGGAEEGGAEEGGVEDVVADDDNHNKEDVPPPGAEIELVDVMNDDGHGVVENEDAGRDDVDEEWLDDEDLDVGDEDAAADEDDDKEETVDKQPETEPTVAEPEPEPQPVSIERAATPRDAAPTENQGTPFTDGA